MTRPVRRRPGDEQGAVAILTAFLMVGLMILAAIVVDLGYARDVRRQSQNASDAASLAGANMLYPASGFCVPPPVGVGGAEPCITDAVTAVKSYALNNFQVSDWTLPPCPTAVIPSGYYAPDSSNRCILLDNATPPTRVLVQMPTRTTATFFGSFAGRPSISVGSSAQALTKAAVRCSLCFLGDVDAGNGDLTVEGGSIAVGGSVTVSSHNSVWNATSIGIVGAWDPVVDHGSSPVNAILPFSDPLASMSLPLNTFGLTAKTDPCGATTATGGSGLYGSLSVANGDTCNLLPGLYVISGTWTLGNLSFLRGTGVTLYVKGPLGYLHFKNGDAIFSAPTTAPLTGVPAENGVPAGYSIIYDRDNHNALELQGNGTTLITGAVYAPGSKLDFNGTTCFGFDGGPFVLGSAYTNGNTSCVKVTHAKSTIVTKEVLHLNQ